MKEVTLVLLGNLRNAVALTEFLGCDENLADCFPKVSHTASISWKKELPAFEVAMSRCEFDNCCCDSQIRVSKSNSPTKPKHFECLLIGDCFLTRPFYLIREAILDDRNQKN